jgi:hypothetical protein
MRLIGRHARWNASASNWAGIGATVALLAVVVMVGGSGGTTDPGPEPVKADNAGATQSESSKASKSSKAPAPAQPAKPACTSKATDDCTPHVGPNNSVRVDALRWRVSDVTTATNIGASEFDDGTNADGTFIIATLNVHSSRKESADLMGVDDLVSLKIGGTNYSPSSEAEIAYSIYNDNADTLSSFESIGPDADKTVAVVFDVPESKLGRKMELRFGELGFGQTEGFIELPALSA